MALDPQVPVGNRALPFTAELVRQHQQAVWRHLRVLGCAADEADDLAQETFVVLMRSRLVDEGPAALRAWLRTTARNLFLAHCRRARRSPVRLDDVDAALQRYEGDDEGETYRQSLRACLETLPERQRHLLDLQFGERAPLPRLAAACGLTAEGARSLLRRIRQGLRECVTRRMRHGTD